MRWTGENWDDVWNWLDAMGIVIQRSCPNMLVGSDLSGQMWVAEAGDWIILDELGRIAIVRDLDEVRHFLEDHPAMKAKLSSDPDLFSSSEPES